MFSTGLNRNIAAIFFTLTLTLSLEGRGNKQCFPQLLFSPSPLWGEGWGEGKMCSRLSALPVMTQLRRG